MFIEIPCWEPTEVPPEAVLSRLPASFWLPASLLWGDWSVPLVPGVVSEFGWLLDMMDERWLELALWQKAEKRLAALCKREYSLV